MRRFFTSSGTSSANSSSALVPGRGLYLKMKLFLKPASRTRSQVRSNDSSVSPQKPTMKSLLIGHARHRLAAAGQHVAVILDRVEPLHPLEHVVAARLGRDVQVRADLRQVADGVEQVVAHVAREVGDELDALDARRVVDAREQIGQPFRRPSPRS